MDDVLLTDNAMKHRKALVSEEDFILETKSAKRVKKEHKPNTYDKHNTYHQACAEGSALQYCSLSQYWYLLSSS